MTYVRPLQSKVVVSTAAQQMAALPSVPSLGVDFGLENELDAAISFLNFDPTGPGALEEDLPGCVPLAAGLPGSSGQEDEEDGSDYLAGNIKVETDVDGEEGKGATGPQKGRRRRIRNAKQQELNRLAQQRYRQRKKQRYVDLQSTVDLLQEKMNALEVLEKEASGLRQTRQELVVQVQQRDGTIAQLQHKVKQQEDALQVKDVQLAEQGRVIAEQQAHMKLLGADPHTLCEKLSEVIRAALIEAGGSQPSFQEKVLQHVKTSLTGMGCSRDLQLHKPAKQTSGGDTPPAIPVSCC